MPISQIHQENKHCQYFLTITVNKWYDIFDGFDRWTILADSIKYFQKNRGLKIYCYVFMLNHIHLIVQSEDMIGFIRDFKRHTTKELKENIAKHEPNILELFLNKETCEYHFWQETNSPKIIENEKFGLEKLKYILNNPVRKDYVEKPEYWKWSSANPNSEIKCDELF
ncbi:MAG: hypothetical protein PHY80_01815 [Rickettsiales bacterium]|nr:hypothetical protein [Rickettsiales bacterium]